MTDKPDTMIMPCKHMCLCFDCCLDLKSKSNKCPLCRESNKLYIKLINKLYLKIKNYLNNS